MLLILLAGVAYDSDNEQRTHRDYQYSNSYENQRLKNSSGAVTFRDTPEHHPNQRHPTDSNGAPVPVPIDIPTSKSDLDPRNLSREKAHEQDRKSHVTDENNPFNGLRAKTARGRRQDLSRQGLESRSKTEYPLEPENPNFPDAPNRPPKQAFSQPQEEQERKEMEKRKEEDKQRQEDTQREEDTRTEEEIRTEEEKNKKEEEEEEEHKKQAEVPRKRIEDMTEEEKIAEGNVCVCYRNGGGSTE